MADEQLDELLKGIGVSVDHEEDMAARVLEEFSQRRSASSGAAPSSSAQFNVRDIAQSIINNELLMTGEDGEGAMELPKHCKGRPRTILLPDDWREYKEQHAIQRKSTHELNNLVIEAMNQNKGPCCPLCKEVLRCSPAEADELLARHIDSCQRPTRRRSGATRLSAEAEEWEQEEEEEEPKPRKRLRRTPAPAPAPTPAPSEEEVEEEEEENAFSSHYQAGAGDDWEDEAFAGRLAALDPQELTRTDAEGAGSVYTEAWNRLHEYQQHGVRWMQGLHREGAGGILADDMGLGKTAQLCVHLGSLGLQQPHYLRGAAPLFLIVCPATVLTHWLTELRRWAPGMRSVLLHSLSATGKEVLLLDARDMVHVLKRLRRNPNPNSGSGGSTSCGVAVVTTYETLRRHAEALTAVEWTAVALDEGQVIRNPATAIASAAKALRSFHRLVLSGTPIQNSLAELWSLMDFAVPGRLGTQGVFEVELALPIRAAGYACASRLDRRVGMQAALALQAIVAPFLLRRHKRDVLHLLRGAAAMPGKVEQVLLCNLSAAQRAAYEMVLASEEVRAVLARRCAPFRAMGTLRKLCNHPALALGPGGDIAWSTDPHYLRTLTRTPSAEQQQGEEEEERGGADTEELLRMEGRALHWADSGKLLVLSKLLPLWWAEGEGANNKVLVFTQTQGMLALVEGMLREMRLPCLRMDGSTPVAQRAALVQRFNSSTSSEVFAMLLTTRTGGLGISLTAANKVLLVDPDWNPMTDLQARERAYRLGQRRQVTVYRLLTRGTIEQAIYSRQLFKLGLAHSVLAAQAQGTKGQQAQQGAQGKHFKGDVRSLFTLTDTTPEEEGDTSVPDPGYRIQPATPEAEAEESKEVQDEVQDEGVQAADRRLLRALFAGDALTAVYDHADMTDTPSSSSSSSEEVRTAQSIVQRALTNISTSSGVPAPPPSATTSNTPSSSSASLLSRFRVQAQAAPPPALPLSPSPSTPSEVGLEESLRQRLLSLFREQSGGIATQALLSRFRDLGDQHASLFRAVLREVAALGDGGRWHQR